MMFAMVLPLPRVSLSSGTGFVCFLAHAASAAIASGLSVGGVAVKLTVPVTVEAAKAAAGQAETATSQTASHTLFPVARMFDSLGYRKIWFLGFRDPGMGRLYTGAAIRAT